MCPVLCGLCKKLNNIVVGLISYSYIYFTKRRGLSCPELRIELVDFNDDDAEKVFEWFVSFGTSLIFDICVRFVAFDGVSV